MIIKRRISHITPIYIFDRIRVKFYQSRNPDAPWLTQSMTRILEDWLDESDIGMEWGSGRSTVWFAKRVSHLISVEHNPEWKEIVLKKMLDEDLLQKVEYYLEVDGKDDSSKSNYVGIINNVPDKYLDFCLVDGRARDHCALGAIDKLKPGGILIVDNINWYVSKMPRSRAPDSRSIEDGCESPQWEEFRDKVYKWRCIWTTDGVCDTALWVKPR